jgi:hypothetical protein
MSNKFLRFEDGKISLNGKELMVNSASLSIAPGLDIERVYGDYDSRINGARVEFVNFHPNNHIKGKLDISFYISADIISVNNVNRLFELAEIGSADKAKSKISEMPLNNNIVGRYTFDNLYLNNFSFQLSPFSLIRANASYDIYGTIKKIPDSYFSKADANFAHSLKSFSDIKISNELSSDEFEMTSLNYEINVERKVNNRIRANESSTVKNSTSGALPFRVSCEKIESNVTIESNNMPDNLNEYGDSSYFYSENTAKSVADIFLYSLSGDRIYRFQCSGKIMNQSLDISEGQHAKSKIVIKEVIK